MQWQQPSARWQTAVFCQPFSILSCSWIPIICSLCSVIKIIDLQADECCSPPACSCQPLALKGIEIDLPRVIEFITIVVLIFYLQNSNDLDEDKGYVNGGMLDNEHVIWCMCHWIFQSERVSLGVNTKTTPCQRVPIPRTLRKRHIMWPVSL